MVRDVAPAFTDSRRGATSVELSTLLRRLSSMAVRPSTLERAFELARTGEYAGASEIRHQLHIEGYVDANRQVYGRSLVSQLRKICAEAKDRSTRGV